MIELKINNPPYGKGRPRFTKNGHAYTPVATRIYENFVKIAFVEAKGQMMDGPIEATIYALFPVAKSDSKKSRMQKLMGRILPTKKPDCDNIAKTILDALNGMAYKDDSQIVSLHVYKMYSAEGQVIVNLREIEPGEIGGGD